MMVVYYCKLCTIRPDISIFVDSTIMGYLIVLPVCYMGGQFLQLFTNYFAVFIKCLYLLLRY